MRNEYLFMSEEHLETVRTYKPEGVTVEILGIENTPLWVAAFSVANNNEAASKKLSDIHTNLLQYSAQVLSCESSEYYNRILFPLINKLERKLRKLLYLAASISDNEKARESIKQLEEKDFGEIFDLLFIDQNFILDMKKRVNAEAKSEFNGRSKYSKNEIKSYLDSLVENTLWDTILGEKDVQTLRIRFRDVQTYRNDVMHAHNICYEHFRKAHNLFEKINKELDSAIVKIIGSSVQETEEKKPEVNTAISSALVAMDISAITDALKGGALTPAVIEMSSKMSQLLGDLRPLTASTNLAEALKGLSPVLSNSAVTGAIKEMNMKANNPEIIDALKALQPLRENNAIAEALRNATSFQTPLDTVQMSQLSELMRPLQQIADALRPYSAFQDSLRSITDNLQRNLSLDNKTDEAKIESETEIDTESDNKKQEEEPSNEPR